MPADPMGWNGLPNHAKLRTYQNAPTTNAAPAKGNAVRIEVAGWGSPRRIRNARPGSAKRNVGFTPAPIPTGISSSAGCTWAAIKTADAARSDATGPSFRHVVAWECTLGAIAKRSAAIDAA